MKKKMLLTLSAVSALLLLCSCSGGRPMEQAQGKEGSTKLSVVEISDGTMICASEDEFYVADTGFLKLTENGKNVALDELKPGTAISAVIGAVDESFPARIAPESAEIVSGTSSAPLVIEALSGLMDEDTALSEGTDILGFDFSEAGNLTSGEKEAVCYIISSKYGYGLNYVKGTYEELGAQGYIDLENMYWENGVLLSFSSETHTDTSVNFSAEKWRGGLGALFYMDCVGTYSGGLWSYKVGSLAIS